MNFDLEFVDSIKIFKRRPSMAFGHFNCENRIKHRLDCKIEE